MDKEPGCPLLWLNALSTRVTRFKGNLSLRLWLPSAGAASPGSHSRQPAAPGMVSELVGPLLHTLWLLPCPLSCTCEPLFSSPQLLLYLGSSFAQNPVAPAPRQGFAFVGVARQCKAMGRVGLNSRGPSSKLLLALRTNSLTC